MGSRKKQRKKRCMQEDRSGVAARGIGGKGRGKRYMREDLWAEGKRIKKKEAGMTDLCGCIGVPENKDKKIQE